MVNRMTFQNLLIQALLKSIISPTERNDMIFDPAQDPRSYTDPGILFHMSQASARPR